MTRMSPTLGFEPSDPARFGMDSVGEGDSVGAGKNALRFFGLLAPNRLVSYLEDPRVDGSIPSPAITFKFMIFMGFLASPADHRASFCPEIG
jgi:hypothetical protein